MHLQNKMFMVPVVLVLLGLAAGEEEVLEIEEANISNENFDKESEPGGSLGVISSIEALVLKMVDENGLHICKSPLAKSVMKTVWRRELENSPDELEQRNKLIKTCSSVDVSNSDESTEAKSFQIEQEARGGISLFKQIVPKDEIDNSGILKSWDALALTPRLLRGGRDGISLMSDVSLLTVQDTQEINAIMKNKEGECTPRMTPVSVPLDPDPTILLFPKCVVLKRCGGCCNHEALECAATADGVENVTRKVVGMTGSKMFIKVITVEEHSKCKCDCRVKATDCNSKQKYDGKNCACRCKKVMKCSKPQEWFEKLCQCSCPERLRKDCATGMYYDTKKCKCVTAAEITGPKLPIGKKN